MSKSTTDNRANNEVVFRGRNEKINRNIREYNETAAEQNQRPVDMTDNASLYFYCECSDEKCIERVQVTFVDYENYHEKRDVFLVKPSHTVPDIEDVVSKGQEYWVVKKHKYPSQNATKLRFTNLKHT